MSHREFANQKELIAYAERNGLVYAWERSHTFAKRQEEAARIALNKQFEEEAALAKKPADLSMFDRIRNATFDEPGKDRDDSFGRELRYARTGKLP